MYPNALTNNLRNGEYFWFCLYFVLHSISMWYFVTSNRNPGFITAENVGDVGQPYTHVSKDDSNEEASNENDLELGAIDNENQQEEEETKELAGASK